MKEVTIARFLNKLRNKVMQTICFFLLYSFISCVNKNVLVWIELSYVCKLCKVCIVNDKMLSDTLP